MGKRKSAKKPVVRAKQGPLATTFKCLFCHHDKSVQVKIDKGSMFGHLNCKVCGQKYTTPINNLSAAVDVYCDWVDACEEVRAKQPKKVKPIPAAARALIPPEPPRERSAGRREERYSDDEDADADDFDSPPKKRRAVRDYDSDDDDDADDAPSHRAPRRAYDDDDDDDE